MTSAVGDGPDRIDPEATLVVTRPAQDATHLIAALEGLGRTVVAMPVLAIEPVTDARPLAATMAELDRYRVVVFVSPNAIRQALAHRTDPWPATVVVGVMGPGSVETLRSVGIATPVHRVVSPRAGGEVSGDRGDRFDSEALFAALDATIDLTHGFDGRVLIVKGVGGRAWFAERLRGLGIIVDELEAYRRVQPPADAVASAALERLFTSKQAPVFVVTSSEGVDNLVAIVVASVASQGGWAVDAVRTWLFGCRILAPHRRIVERARDAGFTRVSLCAPGDSGIVAAIESSGCRAPRP